MISDLTHRAIDDFPLKWRFTDPKYVELSDAHLAQVRPLDEQSSRRLWDYIGQSGLHGSDPFRAGFFRNLESVSTLHDEGDYAGEDSRVRNWLYQCALPFEKRVLLSWQPDLAVETTWQLLVKYWSDFYYPTSDDLTVCDESLEWALLFHHAGKAFFGTNAPQTPNTEQVGAQNL